MIDRLCRAGARVAVLAALWLAPGGPAQAQGSFFDQAKDLLLGGGESLTGDEIAAGLREALEVGSGRVVDQVGRLDGFNGDPEIHIPLPGALKEVQSALKPLGLSGLADDLELQLNRGAERAAPEARALFQEAIAAMTLEDARRIYDGPEDAATRYFQGKMTGPLSERMKPIVNDSLSEVGALGTYDEMMGKYRSIPFVPDVKSDLTGHVVGKALDGIFHYIAQEEAAIRRDPAKRTTELLQKVFGQK